MSKLTREQAAELRALIEDYAEEYADHKAEAAKFDGATGDAMKAARKTLDDKINAWTK